MAQPQAGPMGFQPGQQPTQEQIQQMQQQLAAEAQQAGLTVPQYVERIKAQQMQQMQQQQPTPEQIQQMQQQIAAEAQKAGMSVPDYVEKIKAEHMQQMRMQQQQPTPEQIQQMQQQLAAEAQKAGMSVPDYVEKLKAQAMEQQEQFRQQQAAQQQQQQGGQEQAQHQHQHQHQHQNTQQGQQIPINEGPPKPEALAMANFLRSQDLKMRTCIFQDQRKDMFKVKRAIRAIESPAYQKVQKKNPLLPEVTDRASAENAFKLLPLSLLALRVTKFDPHDGHDHGKKKRVKGLWTVKVEPHQEARDDYYYVWLYEGSQWKNKLYAVGALVLILAVVFFPVWPYHLRLGVWYLSMGMLGLLGLFFGMAIFRLILFIITMFTHAPGLWLYPNLFEDVGFFDSFKPLWAWHEDELAIKKRKKEERERKRTKRDAKAQEKAAALERKAGKTGDNLSAPGSAANSRPITPAPGTTGAETSSTDGLQQRNLRAKVEEEEDESA